MENHLDHEGINQKIFFIRGHRVMLDLALLYGVQTKVLNRAVRRNIIRFPADFMFQLTEIEEEFLRYQIGTSSFGRTARSFLDRILSKLKFR